MVTQKDSFSLFKEGVILGSSEADRANSIIIDTQKFDYEFFEKHGEVNPKDIELLRETLNKIKPGYGNNIGDSLLSHILRGALQHGAGVHHNISMFQVNNKFLDFLGIPYEKGSRQEIFKIIFSGNVDIKTSLTKGTGLSTSELKEVPGLDRLWPKIEGLHEGAHLNKSVRSTTANELISDKKAIEWLENNGHHAIAQAVKDYRILGSGHDLATGIDFDIDHATGLALGSDEKINKDYKGAAQTFGRIMLDKVISTHNISEADAIKMRKENPEKYIKTIEQALEKGEFKDPKNEYVEKHIKAYVGAFRRQVKGVAAPFVKQSSDNNASSEQSVKQDDETNNIKKPHVQLASTDISSKENTANIQLSSTLPAVNLNDINGGHAKVDLMNSDRASMTIGGVSPSLFFSSIAHPELAVEKIAMQEMADKNVTDFSFMSEHQVMNNNQTPI